MKNTIKVIAQLITVVMCSIFFSACAATEDTNYDNEINELISKIDFALDDFFSNDSWRTYTTWVAHGYENTDCFFSVHKYKGNTVAATDHTNSTSDWPVYFYNNNEIYYSSFWQINPYWQNDFTEYLKGRNTYRRHEILTPQKAYQNNNVIVLEYSSKSAANKVYNNYCVWIGFGQPDSIKSIKQTVVLTEHNKLDSIIFTYSFVGFDWETQKNINLKSDVTFQFFPGTGRIDIPVEARHFFEGYYD